MFKHCMLFVALAGLVAAAVGVVDIWSDRQYVVAVVAPEPLYSSPPHTYPNVNPITETLEPGQSLQVLRVRYGKDFEALEVKTSNGHTGWVLSGGGVHVISRGGRNGS